MHRTARGHQFCGSTWAATLIPIASSCDQWDDQILRETQQSEMGRRRGTIRPQSVGRLRRSQNGASSGPSSAPPVSDWVSKSQSFLVGLLDTARRLLGSFGYGLVAFVVERPGDFLVKKEAEGKVLPWATLMLVASALASALFASDLSYSKDQPRWLDSLTGLADPTSYLHRFLPIVALGLCFCFISWLASRMLSARHRDGAALLVASTGFSIIVAALTFETITADLLNKWVVNIPAWEPYDSWRAGYIFFHLPVAIGCSLVAGRALWRTTFSRLPWKFVRRFVKVAVAIVWVPLCFEVPTFVGKMLSVALDVSPRLIEYVNPELKYDPWESASYTPLPIKCDLQRSEGEHRTMSCRLYGVTMGRGSAVLDLGEATIFGSKSRIRSGPQERYRFSEQNSVAENGFPFEAERVLLGFDGLAKFKVGGELLRDPTVIVDLGKPLAIDLVIDLDAACSSGRLADFLKKVENFDYLYLRATPLRIRTISQLKFDFAALGPWRLQGLRDSLAWQCESK